MRSDLSVTLSSSVSRIRSRTGTASTPSTRNLVGPGGVSDGVSFVAEAGGSGVSLGRLAFLLRQPAGDLEWGFDDSELVVVRPFRDFVRFSLLVVAPRRGLNHPI